MNFYNVRLSQIKTILTLFCAFFFFFEFLAVSSYSKSVTDLPNNDLKMTGVRGGVEVRGDSSRGWKRETGRYERENGSDMKEHDGKYEGSIDRIDETDNRRNDVAEMISETPTSSNALKPSPTLPSNFKASRVAPKGKTKFKSSLHSMEKKKYNDPDSSFYQLAASSNLYTANKFPFPEKMLDTGTFYHIVIPYRDGGGMVIEAVKSVLMQDYTRHKCHVWVYNDGSTDQSVSMLFAHYSTDSRVTIMSSSSGISEGPAAGKFYAFQAVQKSPNTSPNDVIVVLDGDDYLLTDQALNIIERKYAEEKAWMTYGSFVGKWSEQVTDLDPRLYSEDVEWRQTEWVYGHPRSFKVFLLDYVSVEDFHKPDGTFLTKCSERGFLLRMFEVSGPKRVAYIADKIYYYRSTEKNTYKIISKKEKEMQLMHLHGMSKSPLLTETIHVIMCVWGRPQSLSRNVVSLLTEQTYADRIKLHVWNNNADSVEMQKAIESTIEILERDHGHVEHVGALEVYDSASNLYGSGRFLLARKLLETDPLDYVIMVDDDELLPNNYIERLWEEREPRRYVAWYGRNFIKGKDYWHSETAQEDRHRTTMKDSVSTFHYGGTGGSLIDAAFFRTYALFEMNESIQKMEDIWLSYLIHQSEGWSIKRSRVLPRFNEDDQNSMDAGLYAVLMDEKCYFLEWLREVGKWRV